MNFRVCEASVRCGGIDNLIIRTLYLVRYSLDKTTMCIARFACVIIYVYLIESPVRLPNDKNLRLFCGLIYSTYPLHFHTACVVFFINTLNQIVLSYHQIKHVTFQSTNKDKSGLKVIFPPEITIFPNGGQQCIHISTINITGFVRNQMFTVFILTGIYTLMIFIHQTKYVYSNSKSRNKHLSVIYGWLT